MFGAGGYELEQYLRRDECIAVERVKSGFTTLKISGNEKTTK